MDHNKIILVNDIHSDIKRIDNILNLHIFDVNNSQHPLKNAAFIELVICLSDLLQKAKVLHVPVNFTHDIPATVTNKDGSPVNITDFVSLIRNAVCHVSSGISFFIRNEEFKVNTTFVIFRGKIEGTFIRLGGENQPLQEMYEDDFCFNFGKLNLFYSRHILRSFNEAKQNILPIISAESFLL